MTKADLKAIRAVVSSEIARALAAQLPPAKRQPIPCGTGARGNWPRCPGSAAIGPDGCTCGKRFERLIRDSALLIAWSAARTAGLQDIADEIVSALGIRAP